MLQQDYQKLTQALNYFAIRCGVENKLNAMKAIKLLFFADRYHLRKYGRPLTNDDYRAMKCGPVGSLARDIAKATEFLDPEVIDYSKEYLKIVGYDYKSIKSVEMDYFSESDKEALDFSIKIFGRFNQNQLVNISHAYPEWKKYEQNFQEDKGLQIPMRFEDFFENADPRDEYIARYLSGKDIFLEEKDEFAKEIYLEQLKINNLWK
jgi:uncharacterized phage-associated protein